MADAPTYPVSAAEAEAWDWDTCPDCGWNTERNVLVPSDGCLPDPCSACAWAHEPPATAEGAPQ